VPPGPTADIEHRRDGVGEHGTVGRVNGREPARELQLLRAPVRDPDPRAAGLDAAGDRGEQPPVQERCGLDPAGLRDAGRRERRH
jgi:hypothetical protein